MQQHPEEFMWNLRNDLREPTLTLENVLAASEFHNSLQAGSFYEQQANAQQEMWGGVQQNVIQLANEERAHKGLQPGNWVNSLAGLGTKHKD